MGRLFWPLALVIAFVVGCWAGGAARSRPGAAKTSDAPEETVTRLQQQVTTLQARLHARESLISSNHSTGSAVGTTTWGPFSRDRWGGSSGTGFPSTNGFVLSGRGEERSFAQSPARRAGAVQSPTGSTADRASSLPNETAGAAPTVETALDRFYKYLEAMNSLEGRDRWQQARALLNDLRGMGDVAGQALMQVLASGTDTDERRTAARLLGNLQVSQALPLLQDVLNRDGDVLLRRAAASGLRDLQTPDAVPVMERLLMNPGEDRFVRLSAASGLAESGQTLGVTGLAQIFEEANADGRGREMAFRALTSLNDDRPLLFMRQVAASDAEPSYRLQAIRYLATHGDQQSLGTLQLVMTSPTAQPSIRDAAAQALMAIGRK
jgi:HEAT repeat protein